MHICITGVRLRRVVGTNPNLTMSIGCYPSAAPVLLGIPRMATKPPSYGGGKAVMGSMGINDSVR